MLVSQEWLWSTL